MNTLREMFEIAAMFSTAAGILVMMVANTNIEVLRATLFFVASLTMVFSMAVLRILGTQ